MRTSLLALAAVTIVGSAPASAQTLQDIVGTWRVVTIDNVAADGTRTPAFGPNPLTQLIITPGGHFAQAFSRSDLPKIAAGSRTMGTAEENAAIVKGTNFAFGTIAVADKVATLQVVGSNFPNWNGTSQPRPITRVSGDEFVWTVTTSQTGGRVETVWQRMK
jgi:hypothetical protein